MSQQPTQTQMIQWLRMRIRFLPIQYRQEIEKSLSDPFCYICWLKVSVKRIICAIPTSTKIYLLKTSHKYNCYKLNQNDHPSLTSIHPMLYSNSMIQISEYLLGETLFIHSLTPVSRKQLLQALSSLHQARISQVLTHFSTLTRNYHRLYIPSSPMIWPRLAKRLSSYLPNTQRSWTHHDLHAGNIIYYRNVWFFIDLEYLSPGWYWLDLANLSISKKLVTTQKMTWLAEYGFPKILLRNQQIANQIKTTLELAEHVIICWSLAHIQLDQNNQQQNQCPWKSNFIKQINLKQYHLKLTAFLNSKSVKTTLVRAKMKSWFFKSPSYSRFNGSCP